MSITCRWALPSACILPGSRLYASRLIFRRPTVGSSVEHLQALHHPNIDKPRYYLVVPRPRARTCFVPNSKMSPELCVTICLPLYLLPTSLECLQVLLRARKAAKVMKHSHDRAAKSIAVRFLALFIVFCSALAILSMALIPILIIWLQCFGLPVQHAIYTTVLIDICSEVRVTPPSQNKPALTSPQLALLYLVGNTRLDNLVLSFFPASIGALLVVFAISGFHESVFGPVGSLLNAIGALTFYRKLENFQTESSCCWMIPRCAARVGDMVAALAALVRDDLQLVS